MALISSSTKNITVSADRSVHAEQITWSQQQAMTVYCKHLAQKMLNDTLCFCFVLIKKSKPVILQPAQFTTCSQSVH